MKPMARRIRWLALAAAVPLSLSASPPATGQDEAHDRGFGEGVRVPFREGSAVRSGTSPPLRRLEPMRPEGEIRVREVPRGRRDLPAAPADRETDPALQDSPRPERAPAPQASFDGLSNRDNEDVTGFIFAPPDTVGDVGPDHYVQMTNVVFAVFDKTGTMVAGPFANNALWVGLGGLCETTNRGDPIILYDPLADRWLLSQFAFETDQDGRPIGPFHECIAISETPDPTGAYHRYDFEVHDTKFNDYPKLGVWPDAYYMTANQFAGDMFAGVGVYAFDREAMLAGQPMPAFVYVDLCPTGGEPTCIYFSMLPSDMDGPPPPPGSPNYVAGSIDAELFGVGGPDGIDVFEFDSGFADGSSPTFTGPTIVGTADFDANMCDFDFECIPQPGTSQKVDAISGQTMHRLAYRNLGTHEAMAANQTVDVDGNDLAGVRWHELRKANGDWDLHDEGTFSPDDTHRWMGSIAVDASGNLGLGYSASGSTVFPSVRYTGREAGDPPGTMQAEEELRAGSGSQTGTDRWGDYSAMSVDPVDECTFWYTQQYYESTDTLFGQDWKTRIGSFRFPSCETPESVPRNIQVEPQTATNQPGEEHTATATVTDQLGAPSEGAQVTFVIGGVGTFSDDTCCMKTEVTGADGGASVTITSDEEGTTDIEASIDPATTDCDEPGGNCSDTAEAEWVVAPDECPGFEGEPGNHIVGTEGPDDLDGTPGDDVICGLGGDDDIDGGDGDDVIIGDEGRADPANFGGDHLKGGLGNDAIFGDAGDDLIEGGPGDNRLIGGTGDDTIHGSVGDEFLRGGGGVDTLNGGAGQDTIRSGPRDDVIRGGPSEDDLGGQIGDDMIRGGAHDDLVRGWGGDDDLFGGPGDDNLVGGPGFDVCTGNAGSDQLLGCEA